MGKPGSMASVRRAAEFGFVAAATAAAGRFAWLHGGQIEGTDVLLYMQAAQNREAYTFILNRYVYVYLHALCGLLAPDAVMSMRAMSAMLAAGSALLVYLCARFLTAKSSAVNGVIAAGLFFGLPLTVHLNIAPQVDSLLMLMILLYALAYIGAIRATGPWVEWLVLAMGFVLFLSLKTKETAIVLALVLPGVVLAHQDHVPMRRRARRLAWFAGGAVLGVGLLALLNGLILGQPWFGLRPSDFVSQGRIASAVFRLHPADGSWLVEAAFAGAGIPFLLAVVAVGKGITGAGRAGRFLLLIPLGMLALLTLTLVWSTWGVTPRYYAPAIGILCVLAAQLAYVPSLRRADLMKSVAVLTVAGGFLGLLVGVGLALRPVWVFPGYYASVLEPILVVVLIGLVCVPLARADISAPSVLLCALMLSLYPARLTLLDAARRPALEQSNVRFYPLEAFRDELDPFGTRRMFTTLRVAKWLLIGENRDELSAIINVYLREETSRERFAFGEPDASLRNAMQAGVYDLVLLTRDDWDLVRTGDDESIGWRDGYRVVTEPQERFFLLVRIQ